MLVSQRIWRVGQPPERLPEGRLASEAELEQMIVARPEIVSDQWMIIGQQEDTGFSGRIDLLAIAPDSSLVLIELKRGRSPREVVAQAIDYATWVEALDAEAVFRIYSRFKPGADLARDFEARFGVELDMEVFPTQHQIVIVAAQLDVSSERIVSYLTKRSVAINVLCFQVFDHGAEKLLSRVWLHDPGEAQAASSATTSKSPSEPWNGEYYVSFGGEGRSWKEAVKYGFISAGGGSWFTNTLKLLNPGDRIWVYLPKKGYVGVGRVTGFATLQTKFSVTVDGKPTPASDVLACGQPSDDPEKMEQFVPVAWVETIPEDRAINEPGLFRNRNTVCRPKTPTWRTTIDRLQRAFPRYDAG